MMNKLILIFLLLCFDVEASANTPILNYLYVEEFADSDATRLLTVAQQMVDLSSDGDIEGALGLSATILSQSGLVKSDIAISEQAVDPVMADERLSAMLLFNHGVLQVAAGHADKGRTTIERGLGFAENTTGPHSLFSFKAYMAAAIADIALGRHEAARQSLQRAQYLVHQAHGVYAIEQVEVLDYLSLLARLDGDLKSSDKLQEFKLRAAIRTHGPNSPRLLEHLDQIGRYFAARGNVMPVVPADQLRPSHAFMGAKLCRWGAGPRFRAVPCNPGLEKWQARQLLQSQEASSLHNERVFAYARAIELFEQAIAIHEQQIGHSDLNIIGTIRTLAGVYLQKGDLRRAEQAMQRAIAASELHARAPVERMGLLVSMGDLLQVQGDRDADKYYLAAWQLIQEDTALSDEYGQLFDAPLRLVPERFKWLPLKTLPSTDKHIAEDSLFVRTSYTVNEKGRVEQLTILESTVPTAQQKDVQRQLKKSRFRPKIADGVIVSSESHTHRFNYPVPDYIANRDETRELNQTGRIEVQ